MKSNSNISFEWWDFFSYLLYIGALIPIFLFKNIAVGITIALISAVSGFFIGKYNKYAFLIVTIFSCNPILWIINGVYLKNRWNHPKVNP